MQAIQVESNSFQFAPQVLAWAIDRTGLSIDTLAKRVGTSIQNVEAWSAGGNPTICQAEKLASAAHIPFPLLLLKEIPAVAPSLPDFRTPGSHTLEKASPELEDTILHAQNCQDWYREYLLENGEGRNEFSGCLRSVDSVDEAARNLLALFPTLEFERKKANSTGAFLSALVRLTERDQGVCVMRGGVAKFNTKRPLDASEFRGFALSDEVAPLVFLNTKDSLSGQVFSLVHELVHIARSLSGVSGENVESSEETYANKVAGRFLIPEESLACLLSGKDDLLATAENLARRLKVSAWAVLTRALDLSLITRDEYIELIAEIRRGLANHPKKGGADFYTARAAFLGRNISCAMVESVRSGSMLYRDMWRLTGISPSKVGDFAKRLGHPWGGS